MKSTPDKSVRDFINQFCTTAPEQIAFGASAALLTVSLSSLVLQSLTGSVDWLSGPSAYFLSTVIGASAISVMISLWLAFRKYGRHAAASERDTVLVVEGRGLGGINGVQLVDAVPAKIAGAQKGYLLDVRLHADGTDVIPEKLVQAVAEMQSWVQEEVGRQDRGGVKIVYGGITAVPLTFLTGVLLDDEGRIIVMDWDRDEESWRTLDQDDDGLRFEVSGMDGLAPGAREVILAVAVSYPIMEQDLRSTFELPMIRMTLPNLDSSHWSKRKQIGLAQQFVGTAKALGGRGVDRIHLVLAAQNSVVFTFGRRYDTRNLPEIVVYQYERHQTVRYPWGVQMPSPTSKPTIMRKSGL
jgi:hypothetical protein